MKYYTIIVIGLLTTASCGHKQSTDKINSEVISIINLPDQKYLTHLLTNLSNVSEKASLYKARLHQLENTANELKALIRENQMTSLQSQGFLDMFENSLEYLSAADSSVLDQLKYARIESPQEVDQILLFMKRCYVKYILETERYLFNTVSTTFTAESLDIKRGENLSVNLSIAAANTNSPAEWFILKSEDQGLTKDNISDTLYPDNLGNVHFTTKNYKIGDNRIVYVAKLKSTNGPIILSKAIDFRVR
ncbi:MAG: hypothetical protein EOO43_13825 [Flavobacterium sp.]|nr:MAG: hypothetical protein EOO43_13825 [Flavobacterium sp.]